MAVHIERMTSEIAVQEGELSLSAAQVDKLVALVISKLEDRAREALRARAATKLRAHAVPLTHSGE